MFVARHLDYRVFVRLSEIDISFILSTSTLRYLNILTIRDRLTRYECDITSTR